MKFYETIRSYLSGRKIEEILTKDKYQPRRSEEHINDCFGRAVQKTLERHNGYPWELSYIPNP